MLVACPGCMLDGDITIDTATGQVVSGSVTMSGLSVGPFDTLTAQSSAGVFRLNDASNNELLVNLPVSTLVGYTGGAICVFTSPFPPCGAPTFVHLISGGNRDTASGSLTAVPGPIAGAGLPGLLLASGGLL